ncbi:hypothetical protein HY624_02295 [Candidatus Uhrbacteria bacterium]|nr:hypothetical protein [Candidatus Uhrbacteria bacterium]
MERYDRIEKEFDRIHVASLTIHELAALVEGLYHFEEEFWLIVHVPEIANWGGEKMLLERLQRIDRERASEYLEILSAPVKYSFFQEEELELLKGRFVDHARKYRWLLNSYGGNRVLTAKYFTDKLKELLRKGSAASRIRKIHAARARNVARKQELKRRLHLTRQDMWMAEQLAQSIWWQDHRKAYIWRMNYYWDILLHEIAKRRDWSFDDLLWCWPKEILHIAKGSRVDRALIRSRKTYYVNELSEHGIKHIYGAKAKKYIATYLSRETEQTTELHGLAVSKGDGKAVRGRVTIVQNPFVDGKKMKQGDILVAAMTSPEFIVVMKKASAIITDHGGMTSHAAIVSRELGIPCIVGTKHATKILKSGDRVEVDVAKGIVKKI